MKKRSRRGNPAWRKDGPSPNPGGIPAAPRVDGFQSLTTGLGVSGTDKSLYSGFVVDAISAETAEAIWRGNDIAARIIEVPNDDALRGGFELCDYDHEKTENIYSLFDDLEILPSLQKALDYRNGVGGGALVLGLNDGRDASQPVNEARISEIVFVNALSAREILPDTYYPMLHPKAGRPQTYVINTLAAGQNITNQVTVHESRVIPFDGVRVSRYQASTSRGWGDSKLVRVLQVLNAFNMSWSGVSVLMQHFNVGIFKMHGLADLVAQDTGGAIAERMQALQLGMSVARAALVDTEEDFTFHQAPVSGLAELLGKFEARLAAAAEMPLTKLMGVSPGGMNATGESDIRNYYDRIASYQTRTIRPALERLVRYAIATQGVPTEEYADWKIKFPPLWQPTDKEVAERNYTQAQADVAYINAGVLSPEEVASSRFGAGYSLETKLDTETRDAFGAPEPPPPPPSPFGEPDPSAEESQSE